MRAPVIRQLKGYAFIAPWLLALVFFIGLPFLAGFALSFCDYQPLRDPIFVGAENYSELLSDEHFHRSLGVTLIYAAVAIPCGVVLAITLAMLLNTRIRGQSFYRVIFYIPHLIPTVVVAVLWLWIFNPEFGLVNIVLAQVWKVIDAWCRLVLQPGEALAALALSGWPAVAAGAAAVISLVAVPVWLLARGDRRSLRRYMTVVAVILVIAIAVPLVIGQLDARFEKDMKRVRQPGWLTDGSPLPSGIRFAPSMALWAMIVLNLWGVGQMGVIYLAKLQDVPVELYEAADIDGAGWLQKTWRITLPMISPVILFNVVMAIIGTFQVFAEPYIMTLGGPEDKTRFLALFIYDNAFLYQRVGYASAVAWVLFLVIVGLTVLAFRVSRRHVYYEGK